jgi:protein SCO1/2
MAYYHCPMLCDMVLQGVAGGLKPLSLNPGRDFDVVVVSIDPRENPQIARKKKAEIVGSYDRPGTESGWHFLTGTQSQIDRLADTVGFHYVRDAANDQFAHAAGMMVVTPGGVLSRYLFGIEYAPRDLKLALLESAQGKLGNVVDKLLLYCFHYDPVTGRYSAVTLRIVRIAALATLVGIVLMVVLLRRRETPAPGPLGAA